MKIMKPIAIVAYALSWCVCLLPHPEPMQEDKMLNKIIAPTDISDFDTTCDGYSHEEPQKIDLEDLSQYEGTIKTLDDDTDAPYNPDDYDSGDYGDY